MAFIYQRKDSPYWWIKYRLPNGKRTAEATRFRVDRSEHKRLAKAQALAHSAREMADPVSKKNVRRWDNWVVPFLKNHYGGSVTIVRAMIAWKWWSEFWKTQDVRGPEDVRREHAFGYMEWRQSKDGHRSKPPKRNTLAAEIFSMSVLLKESVQRGWIRDNPFSRLNIKCELATEKAEMTDDHAAVIRHHIEQRCKTAKTDNQKKEAEFLRVSFEIAWHQGCRMAETYFPMDAINLERETISLVGKGSRPFIQPINPELLPLFQELIATGRTFTYDKVRSPTLCWWTVFHTLRKQNPSFAKVSFHSTRVRMVSRMARAGVPEALAMRMVNHSSSTIHRIYRRIRPEELASYWDRIKEAK
jgi:site-specific recombinase XerD